MPKKAIKRELSDFPKPFILVIKVVPNLKENRCDATASFRGKNYLGFGLANVDALRSLFVLLRDSGDLEKK